MCWIGNINDTERIAEEDKTCYKIVKMDLSRNLRSYFQSFPYEFDKEYKTTLRVYLDGYRETILNGFHSYLLKEMMLDHQECISVHWFLKIEVYYKPAFVVECIIPKGSKYFINSFNELVSEAIIIKDFVRGHY